MFAELGLELAERVDEPGVSDAEARVFDDLLAFAGGERDAVARIPWAPQVALAAGPLFAAVRSPEELAEPAGWLVEVGEFRGGVGRFSLLPVVGAEWSGPAVGPHRHCASPPVPVPARLAGMRRVSIQTVAVDSCLQWMTVDVFFGSDGRVAGVSSDRFEP